MSPAPLQPFHNFPAIHSSGFIPFQVRRDQPRYFSDLRGNKLFYPKRFRRRRMLRRDHIKNDTALKDYNDETFADFP